MQRSFVVNLIFSFGLKVLLIILLSHLAGFGHARMLGSGFPTLRKKEEPIKEAEGLHLGLLSGRDGWFVLLVESVR